MSTNQPIGAGRESVSGGGMSGADTTGVNTQGGQLLGGSLPSPMSETQENRVSPFGSTGTPQPIKVPILTPGAEQTSLVAFLGHDPDDPPAHVVEGYGPRLVVLTNFLSGPGTIESGSFERGDVVWLSQLLGQDIMDNDAEARRQLRRYLSINAVREATQEEAKYTKITFLEGEAALAAALTTTQAANAARDQENARLRQLISDLGLNPEASPEELQAQMAERLGGSSTLGTPTEETGPAGIPTTPLPPPPPAKGQEETPTVVAPPATVTPPQPAAPVVRPAGATPATGGGTGDDAQL